MKSVHSISILGCGWLGLPLAVALQKEGYHVKGSTTSIQKISSLSSFGIEPYHLTIDSQIKGDSLDSFFQSDCLFLNIPFKRDFADPTMYAKQMEIVVNRIKQSPISWVIFTSSTAVYPALIGEAREGDSFKPDNLRSIVLKKIEEMLMAEKSFDTTIIRFAGLFGDGRLIGKFLAGERNLSGGNNPVNLIHLEDAIGLIQSLIRKNIRNEILNACSDDHPPRKELYRKAAQSSGFPLPIFSGEEITANKIVSNEKIKRLLNYTFKFPDPMECV